MFYTTTKVGKILNLTKAGVIYRVEHGILNLSGHVGNRSIFSKQDVLDYINTISKRKAIDITEDFKIVYEEK